MKKLILNFKSKDSKKIKNPKNFLGGKGANLSEMGRIGLPVPSGFTITTKVLADNTDISTKIFVIGNETGGRTEIDLTVTNNPDISVGNTLDSTL